MKIKPVVTKPLWHRNGILLHPSCTAQEAVRLSHFFGTIVLWWGGEPFLP